MSEQLDLENYESGICFNCGAKMVEYRHSFNRGMAVVLRKMYQAGEPVQLGDLSLTPSQYTNTYKIRFWGLADTINGENMDIRKGGRWKLTPEGKSFVEGGCWIQKSVVTYRGKRIRFEGPKIGFRSVMEGYEYRQDFADQASNQLR